MYRTILIISYSNYIFTDKLIKMLDGINYDMIKKQYEFEKYRSDNILYAVYVIETFSNIRNILIKKLEKEFDKYPVDLYKLLGLTQSTATEESIKKAYKKKALLYHPDRNANKSDMQKVSDYFLKKYKNN